MPAWRDRIFVVLFLVKWQSVVTGPSLESQVFSSFEKNAVLLLGALHQGVQKGFRGSVTSVRTSQSNSVILAEL